MSMTKNNNELHYYFLQIYLISITSDVSNDRNEIKDDTTALNAFWVSQTSRPDGRNRLETSP